MFWIEAWGCAYGHEVHLPQIPLFRSTEYFFSIGNIVLIPNPVHTLVRSLTNDIIPPFKPDR